MNPTVLLIRHGETTLNDPKNEKVRGYSDVPIDHEGTEKAHQIGKFLRAFPVRHILSSPLQRAVMTASIVREETGGEVRPTPGLLPWNLGDYTEQPIAEVGPKMDKLQDYPDLKAPHGESYRDFYERWSAALHSMLEYAELHKDETVVGVVHSRNLLSLPTILGGGEIGDVPVKGGPDPASVSRVYQDDEGWKTEVIYK